jgi:hypothetical protein
VIVATAAIAPSHAVWFNRSPSAAGGAKFPNDRGTIERFCFG